MYESYGVTCCRTLSLAPLLLRVVVFTIRVFFVYLVPDPYLCWCDVMCSFLSILET